MANALTEKGYLHYIGNEESGNKNGKTWSKKTFVIKVPIDKKDKYIAFTIWGDKFNELVGIDIGNKIDVMFSIDSTFFGNKWYTNLTAIKVFELDKGTENKAKSVQKEEPQDDEYDLNEYKHNPPKNNISFDGDIESLDLPF